MRLEIDVNADFSECGGFGNAVLYQMCEAAPYHAVQSDSPIFNCWEKIRGITTSKIWIIGRSYAASPQRTRVKLENEGSYDFFDVLVDNIGELKFKELDHKISMLKARTFTGDYTNNDRDVLISVITLVEHYNNLLSAVTGKNNISFASKYLHFHIQKLIFIIDDYARRGGKLLYNEQNLDLCEKEKLLFQNFDSTIRDYAQHVFRCYALTMNMKMISRRELDTILVRRGYPKKDVKNAYSLAISLDNM